MRRASLELEITPYAAHCVWLSKQACGESPSISRDMAVLSMSALNRILATVEDMKLIPAACTGPDGQVFYSWHSGSFALSLDIPNTSGAMEWFYRDSKTRKYWGEDWNVNAPLSERVLHALEAASLNRRAKDE